ncbi:uncharacterized protein LOC130736811 [Lotus japonicus]|uniref:uncharacterized protein LOC130736811 n=1 Tax=Lotus japonicus TaxID=34305 RepID=UPI00258B8884|nr:uncharacterized protein LOC130736811 [Lotus japonicus]
MVDGFFMVKSAYRCIKDWQRRDMAGSSSVGSSLVWKYLRKLNILPRQAHFIWRILCKAIPTWQRLWNWGVACPLWCPRCDGVVECLEHLMWECSWSRSFWFASPLGIMWGSDNQEDFCTWLTGMILEALVDVVEWVCGSCYGFGRARNLACFEGKLVDAGIAAIVVVHEVQEYQKVRASLQTRYTSLPTSASTIWQFPPRGKAELNVDDDQGSGGWTRGVVIQNDEGSVLAAVERTWGGLCGG